MDFGIVYHLETAQQFWLELQDVRNIEANTSLAGLDLALKTYIDLCANHHDKFLQTKAQMDHAIGMLLDSELFTFHSERSSDYVLEEAKTTTDPHTLLILFKILYHHSQRTPSFPRSLKKWQPLLPLLMDHILVDIDDDGWYSNNVSGVGSTIEARLRTLAVCLLYEVCRVQRIDPGDLRLFTDQVINQLFDLVEQTRDHPDETLNYALIKLLISMNEQFMLAALPTNQPPHQHKHANHEHAPSDTLPGSSSSNNGDNRVLQVLIRRLGSSKTFGENLIFMLNRADGTSDDLCMQLLVLKLLYLLFTTKGAQEYFYTNDLRVLTDVFIRELVDLPEERESLRHTYLRVMHPLLTQTQLKTHPYKRPQIRNVLSSLVAHGHIRDISPTTKRLVDRCLAAQWCKELEKEEQRMMEVAKACEAGEKERGATHTGANGHLGVPGGSGAKTIHRAASMDMSSIREGNAAAKGVTSTDVASPSPPSSITGALDAKERERQEKRISRTKSKPPNLLPTPAVLVEDMAACSGLSTASSNGGGPGIKGNDSCASLVTITAASPSTERPIVLSSSPPPSLSSSPPPGAGPTKKRRPPPPPSAPPHSKRDASVLKNNLPSSKFGMPEKSLLLPAAEMARHQNVRSSSLSEVAESNLAGKDAGVSVNGRVTQDVVRRSAPSPPMRRKAPAPPRGTKSAMATSSVTVIPSANASTLSVG